MIMKKNSDSEGTVSSFSFSSDGFSDNEVVPTAGPLVDGFHSTPAVMSEPTEPSKWHTLSSLLPLFQLLPALKLQSHSYVLSGPITRADISLLCAHTKLVKTLSFTGISETTKETQTLDDDTHGPRGGKAPNPTVPCPSISDSAFIHLLPHLPNGRLLPSLERVIIIDTAWAEFRHAYPVFMVPTLREIELLVSAHSEHVLVPLFSSLPFEVPGLQKLALRAQAGYRLPSEVVDAIAGMNALCHLELDDTVNVGSVDLLKKMGQLPELTTFIVKDTAPTYSPLKESAAEEEKGFKNLYHLSVTASFSLISNLLQYVKSELESLKISPVVNVSYDESEARIEEAARVKAEREYLKSKTKIEFKLFRRCLLQIFFIGARYVLHLLSSIIHLFSPIGLLLSPIIHLFSPIGLLLLSSIILLLSPIVLLLSSIIPLLSPIVLLSPIIPLLGPIVLLFSPIIFLGLIVLLLGPLFVLLLIVLARSGSRRNTSQILYQNQG